ncbi:ribosome maturation factor RimM [Ideonella sp. 4Y16]|uniref:Ribosome maturation factor RimM n=1 Tax=Ideonella alba TaxID=2824118 RepID=A0A940YCV4_9BURK|nr:ribosome maturation factor RimM [Ideonella alba]MBQ0932811.1 ribosome maturation factor RimM [Ideonella alba]MBQ0945973.1 ribosome maturation factor RimM [Ideonella alba]
MTSPDAVSWPDDAVEVGRIIDAWGIKGGFKVQPFSADPQALFSSRRWFLQPADAAPGKGVAAVRAAKPAPLPALLKITSAKEHGEVVVATAQDIPDRNAAEALKGARVFVSRQSFPTADPDEFYWVDLIGLQVLNREGAVLGTVTDLLETGAHCVLRVRRPDAAADAPPDEAERLIPFVAAYVDEVDLPGRCLLVDWGLDY